MKFVLLLFFLLLSTKSFSLSIKCKFEEVYSDKSIQHGFMLLKENSLRYQYYDNQLFTIVHKNNNSFVVRNDNKSIIQKLKKEEYFIEDLMKLLKDYPNLNKNYQSNGYNIKLENSSLSNFYKRIAVSGENLNLSIYFNDCETYDAPDHYFNHNPLSEYIF